MWYSWVEKDPRQYFFIWRNVMQRGRKRETSRRDPRQALDIRRLRDIYQGFLSRRGGKFYDETLTDRRRKSSTSTYKSIRKHSRMQAHDELKETRNADLLGWSWRSDRAPRSIRRLPSFVLSRSFYSPTPRITIVGRLKSRTSYRDTDNAALTP